jgi:DNA-binding response OmpR family regulator
MEPPAQPSNGNSPLAGMSVLIVEDDYFVATDFAAVLRAHGASVLGPVPDVERGRALVNESPDCVLLDVNLKGVFSFELAEELLGRGVPTVFTTGYDSSFLPASMREIPCLLKPIEAHQLVRAVQERAGRSAAR